MGSKALSIATGAAMLLAGCDASEDAAAQGSDGAPGYVIDPVTGEERMVIEGKDGAVALRAGPQVPASLPPGFSLFPGAAVLHTAQVTRPDGEAVLATFTADAPAAAVMEHTSKEALAAGFAITAALETGEVSTITATRAADGARLSLTVTAGTPARGQLTIDTGGR